MQKRTLQSLALALTLAFAAGAIGCVGVDDGSGDPGATPSPGPSPTIKALVGPTSEATQAASDFKKTFPSSRIFFSQTTGDLLWIDGNGTALAHGATDTTAQALKVMQNFMSSYPGLYRITDPQTSLGAASSDLRTSGQAQGVVSLHFEELQNGVAIQGRHGTATFDASGNLLSISSNILPSSDFVEESGATAARATAPRPASRQLWSRRADTGLYRLIEERVESTGIQTIRTLRDARSGEIIETIDETPADLVTPPSGWDSLTYSLVNAHDSLGAIRQVPTTIASGDLVLGFHLPGIHAPGMAAHIADAGSSSNPALAPETPIASNAADWLSEPAFDPALRAASTLAINLLTTLNWYKANLAWSSWDNQGTTIFTAVRGNRSGTSVPQLNAWGGGGMILIGDGLTGTDQPLSDALDVVAHEFTHSVISATTPFVYAGESGALNESLADVFGKTAQGFPDFIMAAQAGGYFRDLSNPEGCTAPDGHDCTQPGTYAEYKLIPSNTDSGGVHTNSGIYNVALTRVIQAAPSVSGAASGLAARSLALISLILDSMNQQGFDTGLSLEEFAATFSAYCKAREQAGSLANSQAGYCEQVEASFTQGKLLTTPL